MPLTTTTTHTPESIGTRAAEMMTMPLTHTLRSMLEALDTDTRDMLPTLDPVTEVMWQPVSDALEVLPYMLDLDSYRVAPALESIGFALAAVASVSRGNAPQAWSYARSAIISAHRAGV